MPLRTLLISILVTLCFPGCVGTADHSPSGGEGGAAAGGEGGAAAGGEGGAAAGGEGGAAAGGEGGDSTEPAPVTLMVVAGDQQTGPIDEALPVTLRVRVQRSGTPVAGATVAFTPTAGSGSVQSTSATTDA